MLPVLFWDTCGRDIKGHRRASRDSVGHIKPCVAATDHEGKQSKRVRTQECKDQRKYRAKMRNFEEI